MLKIAKSAAFTGTGAELTSIFGGNVNTPWREVRELRRNPLGFAILGLVDGRKFLVFLDDKEITTLIGILREASDARIRGFKEIAEG